MLWVKISEVVGWPYILSLQAFWVFSALLYLTMVRFARYRRATAAWRTHGIRSREELSFLTADQAQDILKEMVEMEFPKFMGFSIIFALFKTYGIPSISKLLCTTGELSNMETASKRTADTAVLLFEFCLNKPSSERAIEAVARMNYLHNRHIRAGKIYNIDMLYTLSLFALEPIRWIKKYEWRPLTDLELCAVGTFWKSMGDKMRISFVVLPSQRDGWHDGLHWLDELRDWSERYEREHTKQADSNHRLALAHLDVIFVNLPSCFRPIGQNLVAALVGDRLQRAMMLPRPPAAFEAAVNYMLILRKIFLRHFAPPRPEYLRKIYISTENEANGRCNSKVYLSHPWYVKPTFAHRWGLKSWFLRALGRKVPGDDGSKYQPEGYKIMEIGPNRLANKGAKEMEADMRYIVNLGPGGRPFKPARR